VTPLEYALIWMGWYGLFSFLIPVYVSMFVAIGTVLAGDTDRFLERTATTQWGLLVCVYFVSYVPALLMLRIPGYEHQNAKLMMFLVIVVQLSDVLQYVWGKSFGKRRIAASISPNKTWAGFVGGTVCATAIGASIWWATPFGPAQAALMAFVVTIMGFSGGLIMSAIKRDRGIKDYGSLIEGHGGVLDRIDSLCFAAPVFFHLTRFFFTP
jgi:phosphatidate cytidylyltransferase